MADETKIIRLIIDSSRAVDGSAAATRALAKLEQQGAAVESTLMRMEKGLGRLGGFMKAQLALMVAELAARLVQLGKNAFDAASGMDELAEQVGVTSRFFQASQFEAAQNGVKLEQLEAGYSKFSQKMGEAAEGSREMIEALERLGVKNLDVAGKLRPTEDILVDVARAIMAIDDPARRAAAAVDFFGKAGTRMLPMLSSIAAGTDVMAVKMEAAGAYIEDGTVKRLDAIGDAAARSGPRWRAFTANTIAATVDWYERNSAFIGMMTNGLSLLIEAFVRSPQAVTGAIGNAYDSAATAIGNGIAAAQQGFDDLIRAGTVAQAMFLAAFDGLGLKFGEIFRDAMNAAIEAVETGLNAITRNAGSWFSKDRAPINLGRLRGDTTTTAAGDYGVVPPEASYGDFSVAQVQGARITAQSKLPPARNYRAELDERRAIRAHQQFWITDTSGTDPAPAVTTGVGLSSIKGAGQDVQDRITKLKRDTARDIDAADAYAVASERGARAVADLETHYKALKAAQDAYGKTTEQNAGQVAEMTRELEEQYKAIERRNNLKEFNLGTAEMERANALLEAENNLINANTEDRARELALVRLKQDIESKGLDETNEKDRRAIERRAEAITQNERLKAQGEELKKANELWTEPLKSALQSIQGTAADMFDSMLEKGTFSFEEIGKVGQRIVRRMVAEFAALAVIRPMLGSVVGGLASIGLVSPATASQLGYASGSSPGILSFLTSGSTSSGPMGAGSGSSTYSYVTSGSPSTASTVYGPTSDASTVYGPTSNFSAVYGATTNASAVYGPTSNASTVYDATSNASTVYGATTNASAINGPTSNASAVYSAATNASAIYGPTSNASAVYGPTIGASAIYGPTSNASTVYGPTTNASTAYGPTSNASTNYAGDINSEIASWVAYGPTTASTKVATENARAVEDLTTRYQGLKIAQDAYGSTAYKTTAQVDGLTQKLEDQFRTVADGVSAFSPPGGVLATNYNSATYNSSSNYAGDINNEIANWISYGSGSSAAGAVAQSTAVTTANARAVEDLAMQYKGLKATQDSYGNTADKNKSQVDSLTTELEDQFKALSSVTSAYDRAGSSTHTINNYNSSTSYNASNQAGDINSEIANWSSYGNSSTSMPTSTSTTYAGGGYYNYDATGSPIYSRGTISAPSAGSIGAYRSSGSGGFSMPGFGGGGSGMGSFELPSWLGGGSIAELMAATPFASAAPAGGFASIEALMASGQAGPSAGWAAGGLGGAVQGLSVGSMLGTGVGIGMGAYSLATSKNTAQTLGGIGQMIGGGMMLIPGMQIPGMVVSALSAILPGMLGGEEYKWPPLAGANVQFNPGAGGYSPSETQQLGGRSIGGQYASVSGTIDALFAATGGTVTPGMAMSGAIWNNQREGTTSTYVISPTQGSLQLSEGSGDQSAAVDRMIAKIFYMTATTPGALTGIGPTLATALGNKEPTSTAQVAAVISLAKTYDDLGKETTQAETALKAIDDSFASLTTGAREYGLSLAPIETEQKRQRTKYAQDFVDNIESMFDPLGIALKKLGVERGAGLREAQYIADNVKDVYVDMAKVAEYYTRKEAQLREQFYGGAVASLEQAIQRLTFGDLSNSSPATQLDAIRATFTATRAQAQAGDSSAIQRIAGEGTTYAEAARSYFASSPEYEVIKTEIRQSLAEVQAAIQIPTSGTPLNMNDPTMQNMLAANEQLRQVVQMQSDQMQNLQNMVAGLTAQLQRVAVAGR